MKIKSTFLPSPSGELKGAPMQPGDVPKTEASVTDLMKDLGYKPDTPIVIGIEKFINWYKSYFELQ
jgi:UDP-glucuronate 4-epimerase